MSTRAVVIEKRRAKPGEASSYLDDVVLSYDGDECLLWPYAKTSAGYGNIGCDGVNRLVHRIACEKANGAPPSPDHFAAHACGNGHIGCCTKRHVSWKTPAENSADMIAHGNSQQGVRHYGAKLTEDDVRAIRASEEPSPDLAARFGVERTNIIAIRKNKSWRHVQ